MKTGGHIKPCKVGSVEEHNERKKEYVERMKTSKHPLYFYPNLALRPNQNWKNQEREVYRDKKVGDVFRRMIEVYKEKDLRHRMPPLKDRERFDPKTGKVKTIAGWSPIREMVVVIKPDTKIEDFDKVKNWFKANHVEPMFLSLHFDEGHIDTEGNLKANNHAHMGLDFFDWETGKTVKLGHAKMSELQKVLADALGMERGEIKEITNREHYDVPEYRDVAESIAQKKQEQQELTKANEKLAEENSTLKEEAEKAEKHLSNTNEEIKKAETRLKGLNKMLVNLEKHRLDVLADIELLENENINNEVEKDELEEKLRKLKTDLQLTDDKIAERKEQLKVAIDELQKVADRKVEIQHQYDDMRRQINRFQPELHEGTIRHMESIGWQMAAQEAKEKYPALNWFIDRFADDTFAQHKLENLFEGSMFEMMAMRAGEITAVASALFVGYLDQATLYAESVGGGGGPGSGWGREKNEDDMAFGRRCFLLAKNMLMPDGEEQEPTLRRRTGRGR